MLRLELFNFLIGQANCSSNGSRVVLNLNDAAASKVFKPPRKNWD
jgi:hypothetical protein